MIDPKIYQILFPIKKKTIDKIKKNLNTDLTKLNIIKAAVPKLNVYGTFERTFSSCLGHGLQEVSSKCGKNVINIDIQEQKTLGIDIRTSFGECQMKLNKNTQTGTHAKDSLNKLIKTTKENGTNPVFVTALGDSHEILKDGVLYIGGKNFWEKIGMNYDDVYDTIIKLVQETYEEVERTIIPTV